MPPTLAIIKSPSLECTSRVIERSFSHFILFILKFFFKNGFFKNEYPTFAVDYSKIQNDTICFL